MIISNFELRVGEEGQNALATELLGMIIEGSRTQEELITHIQSRALDAFGEELNREEAYRRLIPIIMFAQIMMATGIGQAREEIPEPTVEEARSTAQKLSFALSAVGINFRMRAIHSCPRLMGTLIGKYKSAVDGAEYSIIDLLEGALGKEEMASEVVHIINDIREQRRFEEGYLPGNEDMEFLRQVLFLINKLKIRDNMFCEFGKGILRDLRVFVADYEEKIA